MTIPALLLLFSANTQTYHLPPQLLSAICWVESHHDAKAINLDDGGADSLGVCQMQLKTAQMLGFKGTSKQLMHPSINVKYAAKYLKKQLIRYDGQLDKAVSSYNAGSYTPKNKYYVNRVFRAMAKGR